MISKGFTPSTRGLYRGAVPKATPEGSLCKVWEVVEKSVALKSKEGEFHWQKKPPAGGIREIACVHVFPSDIRAKTLSLLSFTVALCFS